MLEKSLFSVGSYTFRTRHILVIAVLASSFTISALLRSQPAEYGLTLNEYDPFFNYRATEFLVENGLDAYDNWHDDLSWYPQGRDISKTSQFMQHGTAAALYSVFGGGLSLKDFVIILPVVIGSLTCIAVFALVRVIAGTAAGLFASLFFAISLPIIIRGSIGWFKAEPIGLFYGIIGIYLFLSGITCSRNKEAALRIGGAGIVMSMALSAWGGIQFFIIPLGLFFMMLPFLRRDHSFLIWAVPLFSVMLLATSLGFERPGTAFVFGLGGVSLAISTIVMLACIMIWRVSKNGHGARNSILLIIATVAVATTVLAVNSEADSLNLPSFRYTNALNPFLTTTDPLVDSVSEHTPITSHHSFYFLSTLMIFAGIGVWFFLSKREKLDSYGIPLRTDMVVFAIVMSFAGAYIASAFIRLIIFSSLAMIVMASIGLVILTSLVLSHKQAHIGIKSGFVIAAVMMLIVPLVIPPGQTWIDQTSAPPLILSGGLSFGVPTQDWQLALEWIRTQTPSDSIIMSWWDYGYWIETLGERTTLIDNLTISTSSIQNVARILYSSSNDAWIALDEIGVDYVLVYIGAQSIETSGKSYYVLDGGGDELKNTWIGRIAEVDEDEYIYDDRVTTKEKFKTTVFGEMTPFSHVKYINVASGLQSVVWRPGFISIVEKDVKFPADGDGPFRLAYSSPSFETAVDSIVTGIFVYEINRDYVPTIIEPSYSLSDIIPFMDYADTPVEIDLAPDTN